MDGETHNARRAAHAAFDVLWQKHGLTRGEAYRELAQELGISKDDCHMKKMNAETARKVPKAVAAILSKDDFQVIE